jgi:MEMO1 family protein
VAGPLPPLRASLEAIPVEKDGEPLFLLRDTEGLAPGSMGLSAGGMMLATLFDGRRTAEEAAAQFNKATGAALKPEDAAGLAAELEKAGLLETPAIAAQRAAQLRDFKDSKVRKPAHAGTVYPAAAPELEKALAAFYEPPKGPGTPAGKAPAAAALLFPHIDFPRGGHAYAHAFSALAGSEPPDLVVALGVAHASPNSPWVMTRKAYETPLGAVSVDSPGYESIKRCLWYDPLEDEAVHRSEHSLEFAAVWLKRLWKDRTPPWVPILCSSFERFCPDRAPSTVATVDKALSEIGSALKGLNKRILVVAAVDFAHVGPRFGDDEPITPELQKKVEDADRRSIAHALALEADPFYLSVIEGGHWRKVCGLSATYSAIRLLNIIQPSAKGTLLAYDQAPDPLGGIVSFAGAVYR